MLCPKCNQPVADGARFCGSCGAVISDSMPTSAGAAAAAVPPTGTTLGAAPPAPGVSPVPGLIGRIKNILLTPKTEWPVIEREPTRIAQMYQGYIVWLAAFSAVLQFVHLSLIGVSLGFGTWRTPLLSGALYGVVHFVLILVMVYVIALIIDGLSPTFAGQRDRRQALKTAGYMLTPGAAGAVLGLLPGLGGLLELLVAIYGIYVLYLGLPVMMRSPREKAVGYTAAVIVCGILLGVVLGIVLAIAGRVSGLSLSPLGGPAGTYGSLTQDQRQQQAAAAVGAAIGQLAAAGAQLQQAQEQQQPANSPATSSSAGATGDAGSTTANPQSAAAAAAGMVAAMAGGGQKGDPVDFHELKSLLPDTLPGMQRSNASGESNGALGMKASSAAGDYQGEGTRAEIKIVDASAVAGLLGMATSVAANAQSESDSGFEKNATVGGRVVHEKYDNRSKHGEVMAIIANRFTVEVKGDGMDMSSIEQYAALVDYSKLEAMKDEGRSP